MFDETRSKLFCSFPQTIPLMISRNNCYEGESIFYPETDTKNYRHINNPKARNEVLELIEQDSYVDIFRLLKDD